MQLLNFSIIRMKVCFTGDLFLGGDLLQETPANIIQSEHFHNADIRIANLEQAVSESSERENKSTLYSPEEALEIANKLQIDCVALSNNHIHDKKEKGIRDTITSLNKYGIPFFGAGRNLEEASKPYWITDELCVIGYCEYGKGYLSKVKKAEKNSPGINPLKYDKIKNDLSSLPVDAKVILHLHWGREHVSLPDPEHIKLTQKLLALDKVQIIVGMHAHRIQGVITDGEKKGYLCLGNFLFPNFYLKPRTHVTYPQDVSSNICTTKDYHFVGELTYKKWRLVNRISVLLIFDTEDFSVKPIPVYQYPNEPRVKELTGSRKKMVLGAIKFYSMIYKAPLKLYTTIQYIYRVTKKVLRYGYIVFFLSYQNGLKWTYNKAIDYLRR